MHYIYICWIILLYVFLIGVYCFLLGIMFFRNKMSKSKSKFNKSAPTSNNSVDNRIVNLGKDYEEASNGESTNQSSTIKEDRLGIPSLI
jgi:cytoskeletal protein RodZ